jgi:hypothetical protein
MCFVFLWKAFFCIALHCKNSDYKAKTTQITNRFATEFSKNYTQSVIKQAKAELEGGTSDGYKLLDSPIEDEILMSGSLEKVRKPSPKLFSLLFPLEHHLNTHS